MRKKKVEDVSNRIDNFGDKISRYGDGDGRLANRVKSRRLKSRMNAEKLSRKEKR